MAKIDQEIIIRGVDQASPIIGRIVANAVSAQNVLSKLGGVSGGGPLGKIGQIIGRIEGGDAEQATAAAKARLAAVTEYRSRMQEIESIAQRVADFEAKAGNSESAKLAKTLFRRDAERDILQIRKQADETYKRSTRGGGDDADGPGRGVGALAKGVGALFIAAQAGKALSGLAEGIGEARRVANTADATWQNVAGSVARSIPLLGDAVRGFDDLRDAIAGRKSIGELMQEANEANTKVDASRKGRQGVLDVIRDGREASNPVLKINREAEEQRVAVRAQLVKKLVTDQEAADAIAAIDQKAAKQRSDIIQAGEEKRLKALGDFQRAIADDERESRESRRENTIAGLRAEGRDYEAAMLEIEDKRLRSMDAIAKDRRSLGEDNTLTPEQRIARERALDARGDAVNAGAAQAAAEARQQHAKDTAESIRDITIDMIRAQAEGGDEDLQRELRKIEILREAEERHRRINELLKDPSITAAERDRLKALADAVDAQAQEKIDKLGRRDPITVQGKQTAAATDGRFQASAVAQRSLVETFQDPAPKKTADNTEKMRSLLEKILAELSGSQPVA